MSEEITDVVVDPEEVISEPKARSTIQVACRYYRQ